jgi:glycosyltransferase involved in cell wall biosynthesis
LVLSEHEKESVTRRWKNLDVRILPNAIATDQTISRKDDGGERAIIFLGRIHESKGLHEIIEACRILKNENLQFRFGCFGAGPLKDFFIAEMTKILGEKFYYGGVISGAEKWKQLANSDVFLLPSRYGEGLPLAMLEAMAAGCVPVAGDVASVRAVIKDGTNGFMVEPYNIPQIAEKLKILLSNKTDWEALRRNARKTVEEKFAISEYIRKLESLYAEIKVNRKASAKNRNAGRNVELQ